MLKLNVDRNNGMLHRYYEIQYYFYAYKYDGLKKEEYENLKTKILKLDYWKTLMCQLSDKKYDNIIIDALIMLADLFDFGAITAKEFENELHKIRLYKPKSPNEF